METHSIKNKKYTLNMVKTKKFKTVKIELSFGNDLSENTIAARSLVPYLLRAVSRKYNTREKMSAHLENMYAARFGAGVSKIAKTHFMSFSLSFIDDQYTLSNEKLFKEAIDFINEVLFNPFFNETTFTEEKRLLFEYFEGIYTNKLKYAFNKMKNSMFKDEIYHLNALGTKELLENITLDDCISSYKDMLSNDLLTINVIGDIDFIQIEESINSNFNFTERFFTPVLIDNDKKEFSNVTEIIEKIDVKQAKLILGYRLDTNYLEPNYHDAVIFNTIFGGSSESLLFKQIREELGLVYFISSSYDPYKSVLFITSGINKTDYPVVKKTIDSILDKIIKQDYSDELLKICKTVQVNALIESLDSPVSLSARISRDSLFNKQFNPQLIINSLKKVTKSGVSSIAKQLRKDTIYLLRDDTDE